MTCLDIDPLFHCLLQLLINKQINGIMSVNRAAKSGKKVTITHAYVIQPFHFRLGFAAEAQRKVSLEQLNCPWGAVASSLQ